MHRKLRPRRSVLYIPGSNAKALHKARTLPADALIFDMEDAVGPESKAQARDQIAASLAAGGYGHREVLVRVNALDTPWGKEDIAAIASMPLDGVLLPKITHPSQVEDVVNLLIGNNAPSQLPVWIMAETPLGILRISELAGCHRRLAGIVMGTSDLAKELRVPHSAARLGLLAALSLCVIAARAHELEILDGAYLDLENAEGFRAACQQGRDLGFDGKTLIHPSQIETANTVFSPDAETLRHAEAVVAAWEAVHPKGSHVIVVGGRVIESLHVEEARRTLALAKTIAKLNGV